MQQPPPPPPPPKRPHSPDPAADHKKARLGEAAPAFGLARPMDGMLPPPPPRPAPPPLGSAFGQPAAFSTASAPKKPIILGKPTMGFNIFAKKTNGFSLDPPSAAAVKAKPPLVTLEPATAAAAVPASQPATAAPTAPSGGPEVDPLEAFMSGLAGSMTDAERKAVNGESEAEERRRIAEEKKKAEEERKESDAATAAAVTSTTASFVSGESLRSAERFYGDEDQVDESVIERHNAAAESGLSWLEKQSKIKKKEIKAVDHATVSYAPFRKDFYIESKEIAGMSDDAVAAYREGVMEGVKIRGKNCPKPIRSWVHCGLPDRVYAIIQKEHYKAPFPIQQQAIPAIMSGRDIIACARTGSGKTLAFVLPMLRHVLDQPPVAQGEGAIALILAPTRELSTQIYNETKKFCKPLNLRIVCVYGGASVSEQISQLKRGAEVIVATPGRMIDMLAINKGNLTNLTRCTFVVLDEADRMFDMGFEPQVCLAAGTRVTLTHLLARPIERLAAIHSSPHRLYGFNGTGVELSQPVAWRDSGKQECVRVTLADGRSIVCTATHRLLTPAGWVEARHLQPHHSRVLCSLDAIDDCAGDDECGWSVTVGDWSLSLDTESGRDLAFAFVRTLAVFHTQPHLTHADLSLLADLRTLDPAVESASMPAALLSAFRTLADTDADADFPAAGAKQLLASLPPLPRLILSSSTPRALAREYLRSALGRLAKAPLLAVEGSLTPVRILCAASPEARQGDLTTLRQYQQLLARFELDCCITDADDGVSLSILDTVAFAESIGFVHANDKAVRLAAAAACLRMQRLNSKYTARDFLAESGCLAQFDVDDAIPPPPSSQAQQWGVFHLAVSSVVECGVHPTYDIEVSLTHSFLAANLLVHNCKIIDNVRPDRQTVLFSATFPRSIEVLAKKALRNPLEIVIGGRSVASSTITQFVEVRDAASKFPRLLELLGKWYKLDQCILIFVDKQEAVDQLFRALNDAGYPCAALHGGMDQQDREFTIADFKSKIRTIMVATSIVARGLDVKDLTLVINYEAPNHPEDYVHRVGRTGRAGKAGTAITFIEPDEQKYAPDLVKALLAAKQIVPKDLQAMADEWNRLRKEGKVQWASNDGFGATSGFKFDEAEAAENRNQRRLLKMADNPDADYEELAAISEDANAIEEAKKSKAAGAATAAAPSATAAAAADKPSAGAAGTPSAAPASAPAAASAPMKKGVAAALDPVARQLAVAKQMALAVARTMAAQDKLLLAGDGQTALDADAKVAQAMAKAKEAEEKRQLNFAASALQSKASALAAQLMGNKAAAAAAPSGAIVASGGPDDEKRAFSAEVEINDYPQHARWKVTHKGALDAITDQTECAVTTRGGFVAHGRNPPPGTRKLFLLIEGRSDRDVQHCRAEIVRMLEEAAADARPETGRYAKYSVI